MIDHPGSIAAVIQAMLDEDGEGWHLSQYVLCLGLEQVDADGRLHSVAYVWSPPDQPDWSTDGLLRASVEIREYCDEPDF